MPAARKSIISPHTRYRIRFWVTGLGSAPFQFFLLLCIKLGLTRLTRILDAYGRRPLRKSNLLPYPNEQIAKYISVTKDIKLWHGTGKYQYAESGTRDVLGAIVGAGSLTPLEDAYALLMGGEAMVTVSTTPNRMIGRSYADIHGKGEAEKNRYGSSMWWIAHFYGRFFAEVFTTNAWLVLRSKNKWNKATKDENGDRIWGKKVHSQAHSVFDAFGTGSDIAGNYPVLFGIAHFTDTAKLPGAFARAEVRLTKPVLFKDLTHIEVPAAKLPEVKTLIHDSGHDIEVFPIELGEFVFSSRKLGYLLGLAQE